MCSSLFIVVVHPISQWLGPSSSLCCFSIASSLALRGHCWQRQTNMQPSHPLACPQAKLHPGVYRWYNLHTSTSLWHTSTSHHHHHSNVTTLANVHTTILEVKRSKFVTTAAPAPSVAHALQIIQAHSDASASHNCYAYRLQGGGVAKCTDDGEPSGTAGRPILAAIEGEGLDEVVVLTVRYDV